jgi:hypothetical protein
LGGGILWIMDKDQFKNFWFIGQEIIFLDLLLFFC